MRIWKKLLLLSVASFAFFTSFNLHGQDLSRAQDRRIKRMSSVISTVPKAGTGFFCAFVRALKLPVSVGHFFLEKEEIRNHHLPDLNRKPEDFVGKTVLVVRDMRDVMPSTVFWLEKLFSDRLRESPVPYPPSCIPMDEFLQAPFEEKLLKVISSEGVCHGQMVSTRDACELILNLFHKSKDSIFVIRFEDFIGIEAGGRLSDPERCLLLSKMCHFLGYPRSPQQVGRALHSIFGKGHTFNPIKHKVGRWKYVFTEEHMAAFEAEWRPFNEAFGYEYSEFIEGADTEDLGKDIECFDDLL